MKFRNVIKIILSLFIALSGFTSLFYLTINRKELKTTFSKVNQKLFNKRKPVNTGSNEFWAKEILNGGYILLFRHAERDKWFDVKMYDSLELGLPINGNGTNGKRFAENEYFKDAVCLNKNGKIQARGMSELIEFSKLPVGIVISSPSCRARQTAELVFGKYDNSNKALVYGGVFSENENSRVKFLKDYLLNLSIKDGTNTVITAHNSVVNDDVFDQIDSRLRIEEGGFFIISNKDNKLKLKYTFNEFSSFSKIFLPRKFQ